MLAITEGAGRQRWSTSDVEPRRAFTYWTDTVFRSLLDIDSPARAHFRANLDMTELGPATLFLSSADVHSVRRTRARMAQKQVPGYFLVHLRAGQLRFEQHGRETSLSAGESLLIDNGAPYRVECLTRTRSLFMHFQSDWLRNWIPAPEQLAARALRASSGWSVALAAALASLDTERDEPLALPAGTVAEQVAALLALAAGPDAHASSASEKLFNRIRRTIRDRCHESGLDPGAVAEMHGISKRYLHHLCARSETTFGVELMRMRLELAHRMMSDARYDALSVSEVSARCGFLEPSHFARRFRKAFGSGPTQFRATREVRINPSESAPVPVQTLPAAYRFGS